MSDIIIGQIITAAAPILTIIISHFLNTKKLNHLTELSNSMLTHTTVKKEEVEHKLEMTRADELVSLKTKIAELEKQNALLTNPHLKS